MTPPPAADVARSLQALGRNLRLVSAGLLGSALLQYALLFWIARALGVVSYGAFALALSVGMLTAALSNLGTSVALVHACARDPHALPTFLGGSLWLRAALLPPAWAGTALFCRAAGYPTEVLDLVAPLFLASFLDGLGTLASSVFQAREQMGWSAGIAGLRSALRAAALGAVLLDGGGARALAQWYALAALIAALPPWVAILRRTRVSWSPANVGPCARASAPFALGVLAVVLHGQLDVVLLGWLGDVDDVGLYNAAVRFVVLAMLLPQVVTTAVTPLVYKLGLHGPAALARVYCVNAAALGLVGAFVALALALHGDALVATLLGNEYAASAPVLAALAPVVFVRFAAAPLGDALQGLGRQTTWGLGCCASVAVNAVADLVLIPQFGVMGAAWGMLLAQSFQLLFLAKALRAAGVPLEWRRLLGRPLALVALAGALATFAPKGSVLAIAASLCVALTWVRPTPEEAALVRRARGFAAARLSWLAGAAGTRCARPTP